MTEGYHIWQKCPNCKGTGVSAKFVGDQYGVGGVVDVDCAMCDGDKYIEWGWMSKEDVELPDFLPEV